MGPAIDRDARAPTSPTAPPKPFAGLSGRPLSRLGAVDRALARGFGRLADRTIIDIRGAERLATARDPFILVANHSTRLEAVLLPVALMLLRDGARVHFLADWNFMLIPGVASLYRRAGAIVVPNKPARPRVLDLLRPLLTDGVSPMDRAREHLLAGHSLAIFPEGTTNPDPARLKRGRLGAARLSLETGAPVIPVGLRFPFAPEGRPIPEASRFVVDVGAPLVPPPDGASADLLAWHGRIMAEIARLSGKSVNPATTEPRHETL